MKEVVQAFCKDSKCLYDVYTKEKMESLLTTINTNITKNTNAIKERYTKTETNTLLDNKQSKVLYGTTIPDNTLGNDGDVYLKYE